VPPYEAEVQPATSRMAARVTMQAEKVRTGYFMDVTSVYTRFIPAIFMDLFDCKYFRRFTIHEGIPYAVRFRDGTAGLIIHYVIPAGVSLFRPCTQ
jgi:hypothetical protein